MALLAKQPVWQAAEPISVNVDFDVPARGINDELAKLREASSLENQISERRALMSQGFACA